MPPAPKVVGLEGVGQASEGIYLLGAQSFVEPGAAVRVVDDDRGTLLGDRLPLLLTGLADGVHLVRVEARAASGATSNTTVQVLAGATAQDDAVARGTHTLGIVARFRSTLRVWDIAHPQAYLPPLVARAQVLATTGETYLGSGEDITPDDPDLQTLVATLVKPQDTTLQAARALYDWMAAHLHYDAGRLASDDVQTPAQTLHAGSGVCRDLAALYVSLLRAAGVPARLVIGHTDEGFHAWAEFYGGPVAGMPAWVPVDVSILEGGPGMPAAMQAFGILMATDLELRAVTPAQEQAGWSRAVSATSTSPDSSLEMTVADEASAELEDRGRDLCVDDASGERLLALPGACPDRFSLRVAGVLWSAVERLDYGVDLRGVVPQTVVEVSLVRPVEADAMPAEVAWRAYGSQDLSMDRDAGLLRLRLSA